MMGKTGTQTRPPKGPDLSKLSKSKTQHLGSLLLHTQILPLAPSVVAKEGSRTMTEAAPEY